MADWTFARLARQHTPDLATGALLLAKELAYPKLQIRKYMQRLDDLADIAAGHIRHHDSTAVRAELLSDFLFKQEEFRGNTAVYDDPRNSYLNEVLDRRKGIPISLSTVYLAVAKRLHLPAFGVGLPGHFVVGIAVSHDTLFFDPFHGGGRLSPADCARLVKLTVGYEGAFQTAWLAPVSTLDILTRMLNNLRILFTQQHRWAEAIAIVERMQLLQPQNHDYLRELGVLHYRSGVMHQAAHYLEAYLRQEPNAPDGPTLRQGVAQALDQWVRQN